jgi:hypothetical protein
MGGNLGKCAALSSCAVAIIWLQFLGRVMRSDKDLSWHADDIATTSRRCHSPIDFSSTFQQTTSTDAFRRKAYEIPCLAESDRTLLEIAVPIRAQLMTGKEMGVQALNLLRQALWQMGGNPADPNRNVRGNKWWSGGEFLWCLSDGQV